ncbi:hypothetical protein DM02DRAFT_628806 [Periconia macrospinosa]|uniref:Uncharacterized protein n=1 Tax=Periconia macrospinosa TaxID=97972 RepID=A0A2V1DQ28_9PLEO|nr:hypothetical protein DM02DRAFT_628806 [Periconia macrospinosa]
MNIFRSPVAKVDRQSLEIVSFDDGPAKFISQNSKHKSFLKAVRKTFKQVFLLADSEKALEGPRFELFMSLPREIRNLIYEYTIFSHSYGSTEHLEILNIVNEKVRREATEVYLLRTNYFRLSCTNTKAFVRRLNSLGVGNAFRFVTGVELQQFYLNLADNPSLPLYLDLLAKLPNLRRLELKVDYSSRRRARMADLSYHDWSSLFGLVHLNHIRITMEVAEYLPLHNHISEEILFGAASFLREEFWKVKKQEIFIEGRTRRWFQGAYDEYLYTLWRTL